MTNEELKKMAAALSQVAELEEAKKKKLDKVDKDELDGDHDDRDDKDIDNDGDVDGSDEYLHKKRKAISKDVDEAKKRTCEECGCDMDNPKEGCDCDHDVDLDEAVELDEKASVKSLAKEFEKRITKNNALASDRVQERERHAILNLGVKSGVDTKALDKAIVDVMNRLDEAVELDESIAKHMSPYDAKEFLKKHKAHKVDFHALPSSAASAMHDKAKEVKYKKSKSASGSTGRMFHAALQKHADKLKEAVELDELTAAEKKLINQMYDKKGNLTPLGKKVMDQGKAASKLTPKDRDADNARRKEYKAYQKSKRNEEVELDEGAKEKALKALMTRALGGKRAKPGYTSSVAANGDFTVSDGGGRIVGRIKAGDFTNPLKESATSLSRLKAISRIKKSGVVKSGSMSKDGETKTVKKENDEVEVNPKKRLSKKEAETDMPMEDVKWTVYERILEKREQHYRNAAKADDLKDNDTLPGKGAKDMDKDMAIDKTTMGDKEQEAHDTVAKAERAGPGTKARNNDNKAGDKKIVNPVKGMK